MKALLLAAEGPTGWFFPGDIKEFWYGSAAFAIVFALLVWKLFPVISKYLAAKGEGIRAELAAADAAQAAADAEVAALRAKLGDADADAAKLVEDARAQADKLRADGIARADADAAALRRRAVADIEGMRAQAAADLQAEVSVTALAVAEEVALSQLDAATLGQLVEQYIDQVGAQA